MNESGFWRYLYNRMKPVWIAERIENLVDEGTPDVYFTTTVNGSMGWIELKYAHRWPKRPTTPLRLDHFTPAQKGWLKRHGMAGANVFVLLQVDREYFIFDYLCHGFLGEVPRSGLIENAVQHWSRSIPVTELVEILDRKNKRRII